MHASTLTAPAPESKIRGAAPPIAVPAAAALLGLGVGMIAADLSFPHPPIGTPIGLALPNGVVLLALAALLLRDQVRRGHSLTKLTGIQWLLTSVIAVATTLGGALPTYLWSVNAQSLAVANDAQIVRILGANDTCTQSQAMAAREWQPQSAAGERAKRVFLEPCGDGGAQ